jgi:hypothetical protein
MSLVKREGEKERKMRIGTWVKQNFLMQKFLPVRHLWCQLLEG